MTQQQVVEHWKKGARDSLEVAWLCLKAQKYEAALFHAHLATEKALKARYITEHDGAPPYTHVLQELAHHLNVQWTDKQLEQLHDMSRLSVDARYADHEWSQTQATKHHAEHWIMVAEDFVSMLSG